MRKVLWGLAGFFVLALAGLLGVVLFDEPTKPPPLASISDPFAGVDYSDLPPLLTYAARDGVKLGYRVYDGGGAQVAVLVHGSSDDGTGVHVLAKALRDTGATVYVPVVRGHGGFGRSGDLDYIGQLEDDLADLSALDRPLHPNASHTLIGFSSGGGFVLRAITGPDEKLFDRFILISPVLPPEAPTVRPGTGGWVSVALPRIIALAILNQVGIKWFNGLPAIALATSPKATHLTSVYSFRMIVDFAAPRGDFLAGLRATAKPAALLVGSADELFYAERFEPLFKAVRPDLKFTMVPDVGHIGMTVAPAGIAAVRTAFVDLTKPAK